MRFILGSGNHRQVFDRAPKHTAMWDRQKSGLRLRLNLPEHGR
jgi:hypothetical protein